MKHELRTAKSFRKDYKKLTTKETEKLLLWNIEFKPFVDVAE